MEENFNFGYEDVVDYVLEKMDEEKKKLFEQQLEKDFLLQELLKDVEAKKDTLQKMEDYQIQNSFYEVFYKKIKNLLSKKVKITPGQIRALNISELNISTFERELLENFYFLVLSTETNSITGEDCRVLPLSRNVLYAQDYDLIFTEKLISYREFGTVAHLHLVTNILTKRLAYFIGEIDKKIFKAIIKADFNDYSLVDGINIKRGNEIEKEYDDYISESSTIWIELARKVMHRFRDEVFELAETLIPSKKEPKVDLTKLDQTAKPDIYFLRTNVFTVSSTILHPPKKKEYEIDEEGFLLVKVQKIFVKNYFGIEIDTTQSTLNTKTINIDQIKHLIYHKVSEKEMNRILKSLKEEYKPFEFEASDTKVYRFVAKTALLRHDLPDYTILFEDNQLQILLYFNEKQTNIVISFKNKKTPKNIKNFCFINPSRAKIFHVNNLEVQDAVATVGMNLSGDDLLALQKGFIILFKFNKIIFEMKFKLVFN